MFAITSDEKEKERQKTELPPQLKKYNLRVNESKTENHEISATSSKEWKKCKLLGSLLNTELDIKRRKGQGMNTYKTKEKILNYINR